MRFVWGKPSYVLGLAVVSAWAFCPEALAMKDDSMRQGLVTLEGFLTGNVMRIMVLGGAAYGAFQAFMKQQPALLLGSVGTGLGANFLISWINTTWAVLLD